jgi:hypothetical protein
MRFKVRPFSSTEPKTVRECLPARDQKGRLRNRLRRHAVVDSRRAAKAHVPEKQNRIGFLVRRKTHLMPGALIDRSPCVTNTYALSRCGQRLINPLTPQR